MWRCVQWPLFGCIAVAAPIALAGCGHYWYGEREPWRHDAEVACLHSGAVPETAHRVRISAISGPGICGADFPLRVSALGDSAPLGYDEEPLRPPAAIPNGALPERWPLVQSRPLPAPPNAFPSRQPGPFTPPQSGEPMSLTPPGLSEPLPGDVGFTPAPPRPYEGAPLAPLGAPPVATNPRPTYAAPDYSLPAEAPPLGAEQLVPLGPSRGPTVTGTIGPVEVKPAATLACPIVAALDQWIAAAVQPAALRWFGQPVVEIKQISAYSCRGMNGNPNARISEHAFGNALDIAEFGLADGHRISVQYGWRGSPEEQGFLRDVQAAACGQFTTVLAPGANIYHYNHIHVDLMRHASRLHICEPTAVSGELVAERARARYAQRYGDPGMTGAIKAKRAAGVLGYTGEDDDRLPLAVPGDD